MAKGDQLLVLDIDSSSLGGCVLTLGEQPTISHTKRVPIGTGATRDPKALLPLLKEALTQLVPTYAKLYPKLDRVAFVLASPWFAATVKTLTTKAEKPVRVSQGSIRDMVTDFREKNPIGSGHALLEALPITVEVNGYRTRVLKPVHGTSLSVTFYESYTDQALVDLLRDTVHTSLARADVLFHTTPIVYAETLLRITDEDHATVVDIGGEVTDITILSHQRIAYVGSIPVGARSIARGMGGTKDGALSDTLSRLAMFARAELSDKEMQAVSASFSKAGAEWQKSFLAVIDEAGNTVPLSHRVFVIGERDELEWLGQIVSGAESRGQRPVPTIVRHDFFAGLAQFGDEGVFDSSLVLDAVFFHTHEYARTQKLLGNPVLYSVQ